MTDTLRPGQNTHEMMHEAQSLAPYLRLQGVASRSPRSRGALSAEGRETWKGLLGSDSPPLPVCRRATARSAQQKEAPCAPSSYLGSGRSPLAGSCARAPHGDRAGRKRRQVSDA